MKLPRTGKVGATVLMAWTMLFSGDGRLAVAAELAGRPRVEIVVDGARRHQAYEGFGATTLSLVHRGGRPGYDRAGDSLGPKLRQRVLDALYGQVKLTMGNLSIGPLETPAGWDHRGNDNDDPKRIDWKGFDTFDADSMWNELAIMPAGSIAVPSGSRPAVPTAWCWPRPLRTTKRAGWCW